MTALRVFLLRLRGLFRRRGLDQRLEEEVRFHLEMEAETNRKKGMTPDEASHAAHKSFGGVQQVKEEYRDRRGLPGVELLLKDVQYALRLIRRSPGFATVAVLSLALGIGANTAIFSIFEAVTLRPLPVRSPHELVAVGDASRPNQMATGAPMLSPLSYPLYQRIRNENRVFADLLATGRTGRVEIGVGEGAAEPLQARLVSGNYFDVLGVRPQMGRSFLPEEDRGPGSPPVIVISHDSWRNRFGGDPSVLGRIVRLNGGAFTVVGVGPPGFTGEVVGNPADVWIPLSMQPQINAGDARLTRQDANWLLCLGRLKPGVPIETARAEINALAQGALIEYEGTAISAEKIRDIRTKSVPVEPGARGFANRRERLSGSLAKLMGGTGLLLLITCANVANLLLARAASRGREISLRMAIGASRSRLVRQLLTESILLAAIGGAAGLLLARWGSTALVKLASGSPMPVDVQQPNGAVLAFTAAVSLLSGVVFGLAPALRSTGMDLVSRLKETSGSLGGRRWTLGKLLVVGQVSLSVLLLMAAGLLIRSLVNLKASGVGYAPEHLALLTIDVAGSGYAPEKRLPLVRRLVEHLRAAPGVEGVSASENGIFSGTDSASDGLQVDGFTPARKEDSRSTYDQVGPHYFRVVGTPLLAGREFDERDDAKSPPVTILNETMARFYFGDGNPIGKYLRNGGDRYAIVGVVKDMKERDMKEKGERRFFIPLLQMTDVLAHFHFEVRTRNDAAQAIADLRNHTKAFDHNLKVLSIEPVRALIERSMGAESAIAKISGLFSGLALLLSAIGLYGVMAHAMSRRTNEIGLRMALGANRHVVIRMVLRETLLLIVAGVAIGLPIALAAARLIATALVDVSPSDPVTAAIATLMMLLVGSLAGFIPAARAARIDPMTALRQD